MEAFYAHHRLTSCRPPLSAPRGQLRAAYRLPDDPCRQRWGICAAQCNSSALPGLQVRRSQTGLLGNARKHSRSDLLTVVEGEHHVRAAILG